MVPYNLEIEKVAAAPRQKVKRPKSAYPNRVNKFETNVLKVQNDMRMQQYNTRDFLIDKHCTTKHPETFGIFNEKVRLMKQTQQSTMFKKQLNRTSKDKRTFWEAYGDLQKLKDFKTPKKMGYERSTVASVAKMI